MCTDMSGVDGSHPPEETKDGAGQHGVVPPIFTPPATDSPFFLTTAINNPPLRAGSSRRSIQSRVQTYHTDGPYVYCEEWLQDRGEKGPVPSYQLPQQAISSLQDSISCHGPVSADFNPRRMSLLAPYDIPTLEWEYNCELAHGYWTESRPCSK